jgi:hypothetical protein
MPFSYLVAAALALPVCVQDHGAAPATLSQIDGSNIAFVSMAGRNKYDICVMDVHGS